MSTREMVDLDPAETADWHDAPTVVRQHRGAAHAYRFSIPRCDRHGGLLITRPNR